MSNFQKFQLTLCLIQAVSSLLEHLIFLSQFKSELRFQVFLDPHPQNVSIDWQLHLGR